MIIIGGPTGTGSPSFTGAKRLRINFTGDERCTGERTSGSVWVGIAAPKRSTVIVSIDDNVEDVDIRLSQMWRAMLHSHQLRHRFVLQRQQTYDYMTAAQIPELHADKSNLFEFVTHG